MKRESRLRWPRRVAYPLAPPAAPAYTIAMTTLPSRSAIDYLHPDTLAQIEGIELRARMVVEGVMTGMHRSPYHGISVEFAEHRPYTPGDDLRHLDWKVFGRTDKLYLKQYQQETNLDLMLMVDASGSMRYGSKLPLATQLAKQRAAGESRLWRKFDHATVMAAALSYLALAQQDRVGLVVFADHLIDVVKPSSARGQWRAVVDSLTARPVDQHTQIGRVFDEVLGMLHQRSLVVVLSDLFDEDRSLSAALARMFHRRHDVMLMQLLDHEELHFTFRHPMRLLGLEDEGKLDLDPKALREAYLDEINGHIQRISKLARRYQFDHEVIDTSLHIAPPLSRYLARRAARLKRR